MLKLFGTALTAVPTVLDSVSKAAKYAPASPTVEDAEFYHSLTTFDWGWFAKFLLGAALSFGVVLFAILFFRRWGVPRLGYFFVTMIVLANRVMQPEVIFWTAFGVFMGLLSFVMAFSQMRGGEYVHGKEPIYFFLNSFALIVSSLAPSGFTNGISGFALLASLFFVTTRNPRKPGRHGKADQHVLESLAKKARKR